MWSVNSTNVRKMGFTYVGLTDTYIGLTDGNSRDADKSVITNLLVCFVCIYNIVML